MTGLRARLLAAVRRDDGYTLAEVSVAVTIMAVLTAITSLTIGTALSISANFDRRAVEGVSVGTAMEGLTSNIILANPLESISRDQLVIQVMRNTNCERHTYYVMRDPNGKPASLHHKVQEVPLNAGASCINLDPVVWSRTGATQIGRYRIDRMEIDKMTASPTNVPIFSYYSAGGARLRVPGDPGYTPTRDIANICQVARISVAIPMQQPDGTVRTLTTDATPRNHHVEAIC